MDVFIALLVIFFILLAGVTLIGHGIWLALAWFARQLTSEEPHGRAQTLSLDAPAPEQCCHCHVGQFTSGKYCPRCGAVRPTTEQK